MKRLFLLAMLALVATACSKSDTGSASGAVAAATGSAGAGRSTASAPEKKGGEEYKELDWLDLMPPEDLAAIEKNQPMLMHMGQRRMIQQGSFSTVASVTGKNVKVPGYVVPLDTDEQGRLTEFFFVPYFGACLHAPPPPPNQIIFVALDKPLGSPEMWNPQWLRGQLRATTTKNALGGSAYVMERASMVPYEG